MEYDEFLEQIKGRTITGIFYNNPIEEGEEDTIGTTEIDSIAGCYLTLDDGRVLKIRISEYGHIDLLREKKKN